MTEVFIRHAGWISKMPIVETNDDGAMVTQLMRGFRAVCLPDGAANIERWRGDTKVYDGLGVWCTVLTELPTGTRIRIKRGSSIWSCADLRWRVIDSSLVIYADESDEELEYVFKYDGQIWTIGMEHVEVLK